MQSNESSAARVLRQFFPTKWEVLLIIVVNGALLLMVLYSLGVQNYESVNDFQTFTQIAIIGKVFSWLRMFADTIISANVATMLLWGVIGSFVYSIITGVQSVLSDASSTFNTAFLYVHPAGYSRKEYIMQVIIERIISVTIVFLIILYVWSLVTFVIPVVFEGSKESIVPLGPQSFLSAGYFAFFTIVLHGLAVLFRIGAGRYRPDRI